MDAVGRATVWNMVEIKFENLIFGIDNFGEKGESSFANFSSNSTGRILKKGNLDELLGDGGATFKALTG